jgi:PAS domain S-box-containing protein
MEAPDTSIHVLHVDDDPQFADMVATFLAREDDRFDVDTATGATEGLDRLADGDFDCVVSDFDMPGRNGIEFLEAVRDEYPDLPFVLYTGKGSETVASDAISAGVTDYLQKGSGTSQYTVLANRISNAVEAARSAAEAEQRRHRLEQILKTVPACVVQLGTDGDFVYANERAEEVLGLERDEVTRRSYNDPEWDIRDLNGDPIPDEELPFRRVRDTGEPVYDIKHEVAWPDGSRKVLSTNGAPLFDETGAVESVVFSLEDITDRLERRQELESERQFIEQALDALDELFYVIDADGSLRRWNDRVPGITGYDDAELAEMTATELFPEGERETIARAIETALTEGRATAEADLCTADGRRIPYEFTGTRLTDHEGRTVGLVGIGRDLTDRRRQERRFRALVEESNDVISVLDADGVFNYQSPSLERILGYDPEETIGDAAWEYIHPDDRERVVETFEAWIDDPDGTATMVEYRARHADGSWRWMEARGNDQFDNPAVEGYVVNSRDVTDRKEREAELQDVKSQYQALVENFPDGAVFLYDTELRIVRAGGSGLAEVGLSAENIEGTTPQDRYPPEIVQELVRHLEDTLAGESHTFRQTYEGEQYRIRTVPVRGDDGEITNAMAVSQNVTDQVEDRRALERQNERLDEFASIVSHDLRSPLNVAEGHVELARQASEGGHLDAAADAIDRSLELIDELRLLTQEGKPLNSTEAVSLSETLETCWQHVETEQATLDVETDRVIRADRNRFRQLLENLFANAVTHGGADVTVRVGALDDGFYVEDDGPGIPESERDDVFAAGYSTADAGTGFGLRIVDEIVTAHGWRIELTEGSDGGARFEITGVEAHG